MLWPYFVAFVLIAAAGAITRFVNQPINAEIMTWLPDAIPDNWTAVRDSWWGWHMARTAFSVGGLAVLVAAVLGERVRVAGY